MARGKVQIELIQNPANRRVTFCKRKAGLLKKATQISTLCDVEVGLIIFSPSGKLYEFASSSMNEILENYLASCDFMEQQTESSQNIEKICIQVENLQKGLNNLEKNCKNMVGEDLDSLSFKELQVLEKKINSSITNIRSKMEKMSLEHTAFLKAKVQSLEAENANLCKKIAGSHKARDNFELETDYATQQYLPQANLNLTLSQIGIQQVAHQIVFQHFI